MAARDRIIVGQKVDPAKVARAKELQRNLNDAEEVLWQQLRRNQLTGLHFRRQQVIDGFIVDFYCHGQGLVVEIDGGIHRQQQRYDSNATDSFASAACESYGSRMMTSQMTFRRR